MAQLRNQRGQLILVVAFALAVLFVALALITNAAIYTENLATRGDIAGSTEALELRDEAETNVGTILDRVNREYAFVETSDYDAISADVQQNASRYRNGIALHVAGRSGIVNVSHEQDGSQYEEGYLLGDHSDGGSDFGPAGTEPNPYLGGEDWVLATDVDRVRAFELEIDRSSLDNDDVTDNDPDNSYYISLQDSPTGPSTWWRVHVGDDSGDGYFVSVNHSSTPSIEGRCEISDSDASNAIVDVTAGTVDGDRCDALDGIWEGPNSIDSGYGIVFNNSDRVEGNYSLYLGSGDPAGTNFRSTRDGGSDPYESDALYAATVSFRYDTSRLSYGTEIDVAPGETDG